MLVILSSVNKKYTKGCCSVAIVLVYQAQGLILIDKLGVVFHASSFGRVCVHNPSVGEVEDQEFKVILDYIVILRLAWVTYQTISQKTNHLPLQSWM